MQIDAGESIDIGLR